MVEPVFGRWGPTEVMERVLDGTWAEVVDGMGLIEPESISFSGTSAAITGLGSVEFSACTSLSLNGVFSSDFDNYLVSISFGTTVETGLSYRLRTSGVDASGSNYVNQLLSLQGTTISASRVTENLGRMNNCQNGARSGCAAFFYAPFLSSPTAIRIVGSGGNNGASFQEYATSHSLSVQYDGLTVIPNGGSLSGNISVYGMVK